MRAFVDGTHVALGALMAKTIRSEWTWLGLGLAASGALVAPGLTACGDTINQGDIYYLGGGKGEGGEGSATGGSTASGGAASGGAATGGGDMGGETSTGGTATGGSYTSHLPECDEMVSLKDLPIDLFGKDGNLFYFEVTPEMRLAGDEQKCDGVGTDGVYGWEDEEKCALHADNVRVVPRDSTTCTDTGKVEVEPVGQSSFKPWINIPNLKLDVGEFQDLKFPDGDKNIRFNNGQADSTIVREAVALRIWRALGYPAPRTSFAKTQSNVWDTEVRVGAFAAHVMVETYKKAFFKRSVPTAVHVWEGSGDPFDGGWYDTECQWTDEDDCDDLALGEIVAAVESVPLGDGFMQATADVLDWPSIHDNQCISALTGTGDDWIHNSNNVVIVLREDGKIMYLPYSTDISGNHPWYQDVQYEGTAFLTRACQSDQECLTAALDRCDAIIDAFEALDVPTSIVGERCDALEDAGLKRAPDGPVCTKMASWYGGRAAEVRAQVQALRDSGAGGAGGVDGGVDGMDGAADGIWPPD